MPRGSHVPRIDYPPIKMVQMTGEVYTAGIEEHLLIYKALEFGICGLRASFPERGRREKRRGESGR